MENVGSVESLLIVLLDFKEELLSHQGFILVSIARSFEISFDMNKGRIAVVVSFCLVLLASYTIFIPQTRSLPYEYSSTPQERLVDAIVLIAMGKMAEDSMVDFSISSIRKMGNWKGDMYLLTDRTACFTDAASNYDLKLVELPTLSTLIEIKALKPKLLQYLPEGVKGALYLDVDIIGE
jgi:hypothetical protein